MSKQLIATLFIILFAGNTYATSTGTCTKTTGAANAGNDGDGFYNSLDHTASATVCSDDFCAAGYAQTAGDASTVAIAADCDECAADYFWGQSGHTTCVNACASPAKLAIKAGTECGTVCLTGYSDVAPGASANTAATTGGTLTGDCQYCAPDYYWGQVGHTTCVNACAGVAKLANKAGTECGTVCLTGYSDVANTAATTGGTLAGNCQYCAPDYFWGEVGHTTCVNACTSPAKLASIAGTECGVACLTGYSDVAPGASANTAASASGSLTGQCSYCAPNYLFDSAAEDNCISKTYAAGTAQCAAGYSDVAPTTAGVNQAATATGDITGNCDNCAPNYELNAAGTACVAATPVTPGSSGNYLSYSVLVILAILSLLF